MDHTKRPTQYKRARKYAGLSLSQAARAMGVDLRELAHIENGDKSPAVWIQDMMMKLYDVSRKYLITGEPQTTIDALADGIPAEVLIAIKREEPLNLDTGDEG